MARRSLSEAAIFVVAQLVAGTLGLLLFGAALALPAVVARRRSALANAASRPAFLAYGSDLAPGQRGALFGLIGLSNQSGLVIGSVVGAAVLGSGGYRGSRSPRSSRGCSPRAWRCRSCVRRVARFDKPPERDTMAVAMRIIDLSFTIRPHFRWLVSRQLRSSHDSGATFQSSVLTVSCHAYTHVDAPVHFLPGDRDITAMPVDQWIGPAAVVDLTHLGENGEVTAEGPRAPCRPCRGG